MHIVLPFLIALPFAAFLLSNLLPERHEKAISVLAFGTMGVQLACTVATLGFWLFTGRGAVDLPEAILYQTAEYQFRINFYFDGATAVYLLVGTLLTFMISVYSRYYLHREKGYKRFFNTLLLFYSGFCLAIFAGNLETLFMGWEVLGLSSFLLIAFYRERYLPVKNAVKVFSIYRIGDVGLILAMWMSHHLWHQNITFAQLNNSAWLDSTLSHATALATFISCLVLVSAMAKSALFPFSPWLPRAMEGPTPSSAIFYGSVSIHMGVFLMLRMMPLWEHLPGVRVLVGAIGLLTCAVAAPTARVQSSVKAQIAYGSIAQIGLIFVELALGFQTLALIHFAGNAFLRTYQLLVSPSVVAYLIREQFYHFAPRSHSLEDSFPKRLEYTLYLLSLNEWNLETFHYRHLWHPLKKLGRNIRFANPTRAFVSLLVFMMLGLGLFLQRDRLPHAAQDYLPGIFSIVALGMVLKAFSERQSLRTSWFLVCFSHVWVVLATSFGGRFDLQDITIYLSGIVVFGSLGFGIIMLLRKTETAVDLSRFQGHIFEHPRLGFLFLLACLGLSGFPISPTFLGEDLIFEHIHEEQFLVATLLALTLIVSGLAVMRLYARIFLGPHIKTYHATANRSS